MFSPYEVTWLSFLFPANFNEMNDGEIVFIIEWIKLITSGRIKYWKRMLLWNEGNRE
jgi:hypothetical protein